MPRLPSPTDRRIGLFTTLAAFAAGILLAAGPAAAVLYKWVDANGRVSYSDQPPPGNVKAEIVNGAPVASNPDAVRDLANQEMDLKKRDKQRVDDQKKADKARTDATAQQQACVELKGRLAMFSADVLITRVNEKGEQVFLDETARNKERERMEAQFRERCGG